MKFCVAYIQSSQTILWRLFCLQFRSTASSPRGDGPSPLFPSCRTRQHASLSFWGSCAHSWTLGSSWEAFPMHWAMFLFSGYLARARGAMTRFPCMIIPRRVHYTLEHVSGRGSHIIWAIARRHRNPHAWHAITIPKSRLQVAALHQRARLLISTGTCSF